MKSFPVALFALAGLAAPLLQSPVSASASTTVRAAAAAQPSLAPCLWFQKDAEPAARFYAAAFADGKVLEELRWGEGGPAPKGSLMSAKLRLAGQEVQVLNGANTKFNESMSLAVECDTQAEIDSLWQKLTADGGKPGQCGWLTDRFGVSWQVVPRALGAMLADRDPAKAARVGAAMMKMSKLDLEVLRRAHEGK